MSRGHVQGAARVRHDGARCFWAPHMAVFAAAGKACLVVVTGGLDEPRSKLGANPLPPGSSRRALPVELTATPYVAA